MKRVALLGATGSIGRQAIEIVAAHPDLELCALQSGTTPLDELAAEHGVEHVQVGGDAGRAPRAVRAGRRPQRDRRLRGRSRDALGARARRHARAREQGEPRRRRRARDRGATAGRRAAAPRRQRALGALSVPRGPRPGDRRRARPDGLRRPVPRPYARRARRRDAGGGARASDLEHGPEDHRRLGHAREQGPRADRGALAVRRPVRPHRGRRPPDLHRPRARAFPRRRAPRAPRAARHARPDLVRAHVPRAGRDTRSAARPRKASSSRSRRRTPTRSRCWRSRARRASAAAPRRARSTPRTRSPSRRSSTGAIGFLDIAAVVEETLADVDGAPARDLDDLVAADAEARRLAARGLQPA